MDVSGRNYVQSKMPSVGLGTYQIRNEQTIFSVIDAALECGYRFIDTAQIYGNEPAIGRALKELLPKHELTREDIFITTKLSPANQGRLAAGKSIERSLNNLQVDYIDLLIIHWPGASKVQVNDPDNKRLRKESYLVMEEYYIRMCLNIRPLYLSFTCSCFLKCNTPLI
uniref:Aldo_ket_red domain-containing protein n=1 Tax=Heterorhabditis bacteriophora TaxID=37862 RepID=A0A1I7XQP1_HETBA